MSPTIWAQPIFPALSILSRMSVFSTTIFLSHLIKIIVIPQKFWVKQLLLFHKIPFSSPSGNAAFHLSSLLHCTCHSFSTYTLPTAGHYASHASLSLMPAYRNPLGKAAWLICFRNPEELAQHKLPRNEAGN